MDEHDSKDEEMHISVSIGLSFEDLDFIVEALYRAGGDAVIEVSQKAIEVVDQGRGEFDKGFEVCGQSLFEPICQEGGSLWGI